MTTILSICGSLRSASSNASALDAAALLAPPGMAFTRFEGLPDLPHFNPDVETAAPPDVVADFRRQVERADGLLLSSPEYAHGIAGSFKNGLDWLVGATDFAGKPVAIINAAPRAVHAHAQLIEIMRTMSADLRDEAIISIAVQNSRLDGGGIVATPALADPIRDLLVRFGTIIGSVRRRDE